MFLQLSQVFDVLTAKELNPVFDLGQAVLDASEVIHMDGTVIKQGADLIDDLILDSRFEPELALLDIPEALLDGSETGFYPGLTVSQIPDLGEDFFEDFFHAVHAP